MDARASELRSIARRQHGVFSLAQALDAGYSRSLIRRRLAAGQWEEIDVRVYRQVAAVAPSAHQRALGRALATGGAVSGVAALALYGLAPFPPVVDVTVQRVRKGIAVGPVRSTDVLPTSDIRRVDGIPTMSPARALIDAAALMPLAQFEDILDQAIVTRLVSVARLESRARALQSPRRAGCAVVLALLAQRHPELAAARNVMEARVLRLLDKHGVPRPRVNYRVRSGDRTRYLDFAWPEKKIAIEFDGFVPHSTRRVFDDDRIRQNELVGDGWTVFRLTHALLKRSLDRALAPIIAALQRDAP